MKPFEKDRDQERSKGSSSLGEAPKASIVPNSDIDWTTQPIKVVHLADYARYRRKVGDEEAAQLIYSRINGIVGSVSYNDLGRGQDSKAQAIFKAAGAFVLDIYRELEA